jgi:Flp pilus assembly protein TadG
MKHAELRPPSCAGAAARAGAACKRGGERQADMAENGRDRGSDQGRRRKSGVSACASALLGPFRRFGRDEDGAIMIFALIVFIGMLVGAGMAVDFMRYETERAKMQATLDGSILAAAALNQPLDAEDVVEDYFAKSGLQNYTLDVVVDQGLNYKSVSASVGVSLNTYFLNMVGIETLAVGATGQAEERIQKLEISLVLDVSGSMGSYSRLSNLKTAAKEFVETLLEASEENEVSISIVPYNANVMVGSRLIQEFNVSNEHSYSNCVRFSDSDFNSTGIAPSTSLERLAHFDYSTSYGTSPIGDPWCDDTDTRSILAFSTSESALDARINALYADGNTAADLGMKWGVALLDPAAQPVVTSLIASGDANANLAGRPVAYDDGETLKVVILMTDGENTSQYDIKQSRKSGDSDVWLDTTATNSDKYSVWDDDHEQYYYPHNGSWNDEPLGAGSTTETVTTCDWVKKGKKWKWKCSEEEIEVEGENNAVNLTYPELWNTFSTRYVGSYLYGWSSSMNSNFRYSYEEIVDGDDSDDRLLDICTAAKNAGITVFTIGFEAPSHGQNIMRSCASSSAHYYDVDGLEISEAFSAIAATIMKLKLIQ